MELGPGKPNVNNNFQVRQAETEKEVFYIECITVYLKEAKMQIRHIEDYAARFESLDSKELTELKKKLTKTRNYFQEIAKEAPTTQRFQTSDRALRQTCQLVSETLEEFRIAIETSDLEDMNKVFERIMQTGNLFAEYTKLTNIDARTYWDRRGNNI
jgi:response regulator RpfG family c-di-GMP phosphodiesterase